MRWARSKARLSVRFNCSIQLGIHTRRILVRARYHSPSALALRPMPWPFACVAFTFSGCGKPTATQPLHPRINKPTPATHLCMIITPTLTFPRRQLQARGYGSNDDSSYAGFFGKQFPGLFSSNDAQQLNSVTSVPDIGLPACGGVCTCACCVCWGAVCTRMYVCVGVSELVCG